MAVPHNADVAVFQVQPPSRRPERLTAQVPQHPLRDTGKALGLSCSTIYQMVDQGDIEHVLLGTRKSIPREHLLDFSEHNTHKGYYRAR